MGGVETVAAAVQADLAARLPTQNKKQREGLALLVATALDVRSVNLMELAAAVPRAAERLDMRYQWISRLLGNARIDVEAVMAPYAREVLARACAGSRALVVIIDQSKVNDAHHMVMVSLRVGERALPLAWRVKKTHGAIGFREQRDALATVAALLPEGVRPTLMGDRFYGSPALIAWCRDRAGLGAGNRRTKMAEYVGLDVSMKETAVSIRRDGKRVWRGKCASDPKLVAEVIRRRAPGAARVVF